MTMFGSPFGSAKPSEFDEMMRQIQLNQYNQTNIIQQGQNQTLTELNKIMSELTNDEQMLLAQDKNFNIAKQSYEQRFMAFLSSKFSQEFSNTSSGQQANNDLLAVIKNSVETIKKNVNDERERINQLAKLLQENPNLLTELKASKTLQNDEFKI